MVEEDREKVLFHDPIDVRYWMKRDPKDSIIIIIIIITIIIIVIIIIIIILKLLVSLQTGR